jgi:esterase/lipase superfamily enzyme
MTQLRAAPFLLCCNGLARAALLGVLALGLSGCLMNEAAMNSPFQDPGLSASSLAEEGTLLVASTRKASEAGKAPYFTTERGAGLTFARAKINAPDNVFSRKPSPRQPDWAVLGLEGQASQNGAEALSTASNGRDVLLYVHGYNETFETAATGAATLSDGIQFKGRTAMFTWPSGGRLLNYAYDRESALWSRDAFESVLATLSANPSVGRVHIVAHSMGAFLTLETLRQLRADQGEAATQKIGAVVFASPDIDIDQFETSVKRLGALAGRMTVISAQNDRALRVASTLAGGVTRAGAADRERLENLGVRVADASDFGGRFQLIRHDLFLSDESVRAVVRRAIERVR